MKHYQILCFIAFGVLALASTAFAALPNVALIDHANAFATASAPQTEDYNIKLGNLRTKFSASFEAEYNDNINQVTTGKISDEIFRFGFKSSSVLPITELNSLKLDVDAGYRFYAKNSDLNSNQNFLDINPGSELAFNWWIKNFEFKLYDRLNYVGQSVDTRVLNSATNSVTGNIINLAQLQNRAGLETMWDLNDLKVYGGYARDDIRSNRADFNSLNRTAHTVYLSPLLLITPEFSAGIMSAYTWNRYKFNFQNDSDSWSLGPTAFWQMTENTQVSGSLFWKQIDSKNNGTNGDNSDSGEVNGNLSLTQQLNEKLSHSLTLARNTDFGTVTNSTTADSVYYQPIYQLKEDWFLKGRLGYEHGKDSAGANAERYHRRLYGVGVQHTFSRKLRAELDYNYTVNTSNITSRPYNQNQVVLSAEYDF